MWLGTPASKKDVKAGGDKGDGVTARVTFFLGLRLRTSTRHTRHTPKGFRPRPPRACRFGDGQSIRTETTPSNRRHHNKKQATLDILLILDPHISFVHH